MLFLLLLEHRIGTSMGFILPFVRTAGCLHIPTRSQACSCREPCLPCQQWEIRARGRWWYFLICLVFPLTHTCRSVVLLTLAKSARRCRLQAPLVLLILGHLLGPFGPQFLSSKMRGIGFGDLLRWFPTLNVIGFQ